MAANHLSRQERQELGRRTQERLRARIAEGSLPQDYYRQLGRRGFRVTLAKVGAQRMAQLLSAFYGYPIMAERLARNLARERERAATRRAYPVAGQACARCGAPAEQRDHCGGWEAGHAPPNIQLLCRRCHKATEIERIKRAPSEPHG